MTAHSPTDLHRRAKQPVTLAAGPHGHPFHPILVTIPIGAWTASLIFDAVSYLSEEPEIFATGALWLIGIGIVGALAAALIGILDLLAIPRGTKAFRTGLIHMGLNFTVIILFAAGFALRVGTLDEGPVGLIPLLVSVIALALLGISGWLGGKLAYTYGVRVAEEDAQAAGFGN